jgi:SAM-dependent methyltransferase
MTNTGYAAYRAWKGWQGGGFGSFDTAAAAYFSSEIAKSGLSTLSNLRVLEIGFGNGIFAGWCKQQGAIYVGTEVIPELIARGIAAGFDVHSADTAVHTLVMPDSVDLLIALDVFEHFETNALRELLLQAIAFLRPGGLVIARVPSGDSPFSRAIQYGDLTHRAVLGTSAVRQLAEEVGLQVVQLREPRFVHSGLGVITIIRRLIVEIGRRLVFSILVNVCMGGGSPVLTPNFIFVLKKNDTNQEI